jgi:uncharacterized membrane protein YjfL (UPF0719 family)
MISKMLETVAWAALGIVILYISVWLFDRLDPINYQTEIRNGNQAAGLIVSAIILGIAAILVAVIVS